MARIDDSKKLFFITSPRTPFKMIPEIELLINNLSGKPWDKRSQNDFANLLADSLSFKGNASNDKGFSARDRITRGPKALGFVDLKPYIELTEAGKLFLYSRRPNEIFTRQILKFQLPSPFHTDKANNYYVKPYLEILRLTYDLEYLSKDEIKMFGLLINDYRKYDDILNAIKSFRVESKKINRNETSYKIYKEDTFTSIVEKVYEEEIESIISRDKQNKFIKTKKQTMGDYADACFRYIRATELVTTNKQGNYIMVAKNKAKEVEYILNTIDRKPGKFINESEYKKYLYNPLIPTLAIDNREEITEILVDFGEDINALNKKTILELQDLKHELTLKKTEENILQTISKIKTFEEFDDILQIYKDIKAKKVFDQPLMLEWNTWRAFTMLNDGNIIGNFKVDIEGMPLSTASGNLPDIKCEYSNFNLIVEVTMSSGQKQYEMEGEPVARHLGDIKAENLEKEAYCIFIAPKPSEATIAHFYSLNQIKIKRYCGKSKIIPMSIDMFVDMLKCAMKNKSKISSVALKSYLDRLCKAIDDVQDEEEWYKLIQDTSKSWIY